MHSNAIDAGHVVDSRLAIVVEEFGHLGCVLLLFKFSVPVDELERSLDALKYEVRLRVGKATPQFTQRHRRCLESGSLVSESTPSTHGTL